MMIRKIALWCLGVLAVIFWCLCLVFKYAPSDAGQAMPVNGMICFASGILGGLIMIVWCIVLLI